MPKILAALIAGAIRPVLYNESPILSSCSIQEALARPVTVRPAGAVPIAAMIRGDRKARGASRRMCRSRLSVPDADEKYAPEALAYIHSYDVKLKQIPTEIATQRARVKK
jgi:hypothetical protein